MTTAPNTQNAPTAGLPALKEGERRIFLTYQFTTYQGTGNGNTFATIPVDAPITADAIRVWEWTIRNNNNMDSVVLTGYQVLEG